MLYNAVGLLNILIYISLYIYQFHTALYQFSGQYETPCRALFGCWNASFNKIPLSPPPPLPSIGCARGITFEDNYLLCLYCCVYKAIFTCRVMNSSPVSSCSTA